MVWAVIRLMEFPDMLPHAELKVEGHLSGSMTLSLEALTDQNLYRRIEEGSP